CLNSSSERCAKNSDKSYDKIRFMIRSNSKFLRGISLGLSLVAVFAVIVALIVGYRKDGEINFVLIGLAAVILSANLLIVRSRKPKTGE
ncbi:MAG: hypothetical protein ABIP06_06970, partial [Pyrinomonadaceae bacterium]